MPSFVILCVSVVFYVAGLILHVATRKSEDNAIDIETVSHIDEICRQQTVSSSSQNTFDVLDNYHNAEIQEFTPYNFAVTDPQLRDYYNISVFNSGAWKKYHARPPPIF